MTTNQAIKILSHYVKWRDSVNEGKKLGYTHEEVSEAISHAVMMMQRYGVDMAKAVYKEEITKVINMLNELKDE